MKKLILSYFILLAFIFPSSAQISIGEVIDGKPVVTCDKEKLISIYKTNLLKESGIDANFTDISIGLSEENYYVFFTGRQIKSTFSAKLTGSVIIILTEAEHISCTTTECSDETYGCVPLTLTLSCTKCANKGKCTKTVSSKSLLRSE